MLINTILVFGVTAVLLWLFINVTCVFFIIIIIIYIRQSQQTEVFLLGALND